MNFQFSDQHIEQFESQGYTIFRGIVPPSLIGELRLACDKGRVLARAGGNPQNQRFGLGALDETDLKPFEKYRELPVLRDAVGRVLRRDDTRKDFEMWSVLIEPGELPYCTQWHRDWRDNIAGLDVAAWEQVQADREMFNQVNCALYEDSCTWIVPGSHDRKDLEAEARRFPDRPILAPELDGKSFAERERSGLEYCQSMPGAMQAFLNAGDFMLYRSVMWHIGNYLPYKTRATIHEGVITPRFKEYCKSAPQKARERNKDGVVWDNPNFPERNVPRELVTA